MHPGYLIVIALTLLAASSMAAAEIYQTRDAEGNPVFSDTPSPEAEVVDLPEANVADAVEPSSETAAQQEGGPAENAGHRGRSSESGVSPGDRVIVIDDGGPDPSQNPEAGWKIGDAEPRDEVLEAERRKEVLEAEPRHETSGAQPRREVLDAEPRLEVE